MSELKRRRTKLDDCEVLVEMNPLTGGPKTASLLFWDKPTKGYDIWAVIYSPSVAEMVGSIMFPHGDYYVGPFDAGEPRGELRWRLEALHFHGAELRIPSAKDIPFVLGVFRFADDAMRLGGIMVDNFNLQDQQDRLTDLTVSDFSVWDREIGRYLKD